jgi:hypothetical protein
MVRHRDENVGCVECVGNVECVECVGCVERLGCDANFSFLS